MTHLLRPLARFSPMLLGCLGFAGCGNDDTRLTAPPSAPIEEPSPPDDEDPRHVYALTSLVWSDTGPTGYVALTDSLDVDGITLDGAREFSGYTSTAVVSGELLVNPSADDLTIQRYQITDELQWVDQGSLSFLDRGVEDIGFYRQYLRRGQVAYTELDVIQRVIWDPTEFVILGVKEGSALPVARDGLDLYAAFNRTHLQFDELILRPFSYHDEDWFVWTPDTQIVVYDPTTDEERAVLDAPCPALDAMTRDEAGNTYFSTWEYSPLHGLAGTGAATCVVRVTPEGTLDEAWGADLTEWTDGRDVKNFRYVGDGKALAAVFHAEEFGPEVDFQTDFADPDSHWDGADLHYRIWWFDLERQEAGPVEGLPDGDTSPYFTVEQLDGRAFMMLPATDDSSSVIYEWTGSTRLERRFEVTGTTYQWLKVR